MASTDVKILYVRVPGGEVPPVPALAPKVGPLKLSPKSVGEDLAKATKDWKGMRVTCKLTVINRKVSVEIIPSATALLIKALKEPPRDKKKEKEIQHDGDITFADVMNIAKVMQPRSMAKDLKGTVLEMLGTARAIGCTIDGQDPEDLTAEIHENGLPADQ
jgi:large subunit ribosomal protein L12e